MNLYDQRVHHHPPSKLKGDCFRACLATLLQEPPDDMPNFMAASSEKEAWQSVDEFLRVRGYAWWSIPVIAPYDNTFQDLVNWLRASNVHTACIVTGRTPTCADVQHCVYVSSAWVHDPHPSRAKLDAPAEGDWWFIGTVVPLLENQR